MKKITCILAALLLCFSVAAMAETTGSKTTGDLTVIVPSKATENFAQITADFALTAVENDAQAAEVAKLAAATPAEYFGAVKDANGNDVDVFANYPTVNEFLALKETGYKTEFDDVTVTMQFATPYAVGEKVMVLIGIEEGDKINWTAFEGTGIAADAGKPETEGRIEVTLTSEILDAIQNSTAFIAVASK